MDFTPQHQRHCVSPPKYLVVAIMPTRLWHCSWSLYNTWMECLGDLTSMGWRLKKWILEAERFRRCGKGVVWWEGCWSVGTIQHHYAQRTRGSPFSRSPCQLWQRMISLTNKVQVCSDAGFASKFFQRSMTGEWIDFLDRAKLSLVGAERGGVLPCWSSSTSRFM